MIEICNLTRKFGSFEAVSNLSLTVLPGELFCFLGPNGAGKTTTIKILTGLLRPTSGTTRICGLDMQIDPIAVKKLIGYIPDMPFLYERLTATEFFQFTADLYEVPQNKVPLLCDESFRLFGLLDCRNVLIKELSHGMRQRLIYASTFLHNPQVLFIDEPLVGLDPYSIRLIKDLLMEKARAGMTIFLTTHILAVAEDIADRIGIISKGKLIAMGTLKELLALNNECKNLEDIFLHLTENDN
ncbi:MAG: ABC transporter ATP-binding protein [Kiritimatiellae bacterium]|nr:ABC transporter ATP-binding protein [Kiritimatiellia bacterium]MDD5521354.1 ABC transporter ATP-binding protein [Kiritimatiellia bacterium]